jgi:hypothetical protein
MGNADLRLLIVDWPDVGLQFNTRGVNQHSAFINQQF